MRKLTTGEGMFQLMCENDIAYRTADLYGFCKGACMKRQEGYLVVIDRSLSYAEAIKTFQHELCHIMLGHLDDDVKTEEEKENEVHFVLQYLGLEAINETLKRYRALLEW